MPAVMPNTEAMGTLKIKLGLGFFFKYIKYLIQLFNKSRPELICPWILEYISGRHIIRFNGFIFYCFLTLPSWNSILPNESFTISSPDDVAVAVVLATVAVVVVLTAVV